MTEMKLSDHDIRREHEVKKRNDIKGRKEGRRKAAVRYVNS